MILDFGLLFIVSLWFITSTYLTYRKNKEEIEYFKAQVPHLNHIMDKHIEYMVGCHDLWQDSLTEIEKNNHRIEEFVHRATNFVNRTDNVVCLKCGNGEYIR